MEFGHTATDRNDGNSQGFYRSQRGLTLLEVILALALFATGILLLANAWSSNTRRTQAMDLNYKVAALLEQKVAEITTQYKGQPLTNIPEEDSGEFEGLDGYKWSMKSQEFKFPDISSLMISEGSNNQMMISAIKQLSEIMRRSIREIKVTITAPNTSKKKEKKPREFSATTFLTDYSGDMQLGPQ